MSIAMLQTTAKYTVIASAYRAGESQAVNIEKHIDAGFELMALGYTRHVDVMGYYKESDAPLPQIELSRAIPVFNMSEVSVLATLFCGAYNQDCILVINNDSHSAWLVDVFGTVISLLGQWHVTPRMPATQGWTYDGNAYYYAE